MSEQVLEIPEDDLYDLYSKLSAATAAAASGDPNKCAELAADAKGHVIDLREEYADE